ncbi:MAG TPA: hypothetical protein IGS37_02130 [Synechococcales cyanobacterium M55_K2018_004]|nr:hypothetical protein [Synechococcales cyanobacterium M55_K2018_004]
MHRYILGVGLAIALLMMSGCGADPEVQLAEISRNTVVYDEIIRLNNCGGKGDSDHTATREFATTIEFGAGISAGYKPVVEGNISAKYSEYRNTSKSIRVVAPPGTNMEFILRWSDDVRAGNVQVNGKSGTYEVRIPISVEQILSRDLGCGITSSGTVISPSTVPSPNVESRPSGITISPGGAFSPSGNWVWICTGDFTITRPNGTNVALYDSSAEPTGLIVVLEQGSRVIVNAPWGGYCEPFAQTERNAGIARKISEMLSAGCGTGCKAVNVKEMDKNGSVLNDYWKP